MPTRLDCNRSHTVYSGDIRLPLHTHPLQGDTHEHVIYATAAAPVASNMDGAILLPKHRTVLHCTALHSTEHQHRAQRSRGPSASRVGQGLEQASSLLITAHCFLLPASCPPSLVIRTCLSPYRRCSVFPCLCLCSCLCLLQ